MSLIKKKSVRAKRCKIRNKKRTEQQRMPIKTIRECYKQLISKLLENGEWVLSNFPWRRPGSKYFRIFNSRDKSRILCRYLNNCLKMYTAFSAQWQQKDREWTRLGPGTLFPDLKQKQMMISHKSSMTQEEVGNLKRTITVEEIRTTLKEVLIYKTPRSDDFNS